MITGYFEFSCTVNVVKISNLFVNCTLKIGVGSFTFKNGDVEEFQKASVSL